MTDPYASCTCGSGKKFKWCCQPIYPGIQQALEQEQAGQHEVALRIIDKVTQDHPGNPEAWGQKARLLYANGRTDAAEEALEKAFAINPNYPYGLLLRAQMRHDEKEYRGALLLARRALDAYDPTYKDAQAQLNYLIFDCEMRHNNPIPARAALEQVLAAQPTSEEIRQGIEKVFGPDGRLPLAARKKYDLHKPSAARREAWNRALASGQPRLSDLSAKFEALTKDADDDASAWYNRGLTQAWLGQNAVAVEALDRYVELEPNEDAAADAATLSEVLRCAYGMEAQCDYHDHVALHQIRDPEPVNRLLHEWMEAHRLIPLQTDDESVFMALVLELSTMGLVTVGRPAAEAGRLAGYLLIAGNTLRLSGPVKETYDRLREEVRQKLGLGLTDLQAREAPIQFHEVVTEAAVFPVGAVEDKDEAAQRAVEQVGKYYEETWIHRPRKSLSNIAPVDAAGSPRLKKKLRGVIAFIEECARGGLVAEYQFDRLRRKLGLSAGEGAAAAAPSSAGAIPADIGALSAADLSALPVGSMSDEQLETAYRTAHRLDAQELAAHFGKSLVARPVQAAKADRFPYYLFLIQRSMREGSLDEALDLVNAGESGDCEHNGGKRRDDFELLRGRVLAKRGEKDQARDVFQRLIERSPRNFEVRGHAAKVMLDARDAAAALKFAEDGVTAARQANNRDAEQMLLELTAAAKKAGAAS
jgi:tetratricopeptide (TPR) repeat protein